MTALNPPPMKRKYTTAYRCHPILFAATRSVSRGRTHYPPNRARAQSGPGCTGSTPSSGSEDAPKFADRLVARAVGSTSHERQYETTASRTAVLGSSLCQGGSTGQPAATFRLIGLWAQPFERL